MSNCVARPHKSQLFFLFWRDHLEQFFKRLAFLYSDIRKADKNKKMFWIIWRSFLKYNDSLWGLWPSGMFFKRKVVKVVAKYAWRSAVHVLKRNKNHTIPSTWTNNWVINLYLFIINLCRFLHHYHTDAFQLIRGLHLAILRLLISLKPTVLISCKING